MPGPALTAKAVFDRAHEIDSPGERQAYLDQVCADAPELRARVEALLHAYEAAGSFLDLPASPQPPTGLYRSAADTPGQTPGADDVTTAPAPAPGAAAMGPGTQIGPYRLVRELGAGGMGAVYLAEQDEPIRRQVALKLIKPGMDSAAVVARFQAERQALTLMDHAGIARVYDAGTTARGQPYFVMELVKGVPLARFCDEQQLTVRQRLQLFVAICEAVQHAHQKGIIHRDLKPANVLAAVQDGKPLVKIIDFGLAKPTEQLSGSLTDESQLTQAGAIVGTLQYMSPEQADFGAAGIDTRTDIYALGVMLYELLTGTTPLDLSRSRPASLLEVVIRIKEEEPAAPSARVAGLGERLPAITAARRSEPARLARQLRGELDWITARALQKDREHRYETASAFAKDVERYLHDEPVEASPPSVRYRVGKFVRRHRIALSFAAVIVGVLVAGVAGLSWALVVVNDARQHEHDARLRSEAAERTKRAALDFTWGAIRAQLHNHIKPGDAERPIFLNMLEVYRKLAQDSSESEEARATNAETEFRAANLAHLVGARAEAAAGYRKAIGLYQALATDFGERAAYRNELGRCYFDLGCLRVDEGERAEAVAAYRQAIDWHRTVVADFPDEPAYRGELADAYNNLGGLLRDDQQLDKARQALAQAIELREQVVAEAPQFFQQRVNLGGSYHNFGNIVRDQGDARAALPWYGKAVDLLNPMTPRPADATLFLRNAHWDRANALGQLDRHREANQDWQRAIALDDGAAREHLRLFLAASQTEEKLATEMKPASKLLYAAAAVHARAAAAAAAESEAGLQQTYTRRAFALLQQARAAGWFVDVQHVRQLQTDRAFDALPREPFRAFAGSLAAGTR